MRPGRHTYAELRELYAEISVWADLGPLFDGMSGSRAPSRPLVVVRHDVDLGLGPAQGLAEREREWGVRATYFIRADCRSYSLRSPANRLTIRSIGQWHEIGLHAVSPCGPADTLDRGKLLAALRAQRESLEDSAGGPVTGVSFHKPSPDLLWGELRVAGLFNAYAEIFRDRYVSDSGGRFDESKAKRVVDLAKSEGGQLLIHPVWWGSTAASPQERLAALLSHAGEDEGKLLAAEMERTVSWWTAGGVGG